jgi:hypothetical protein
MVSATTARSFALSLPRTTEGLVSDSVRFRVGRLVYVAFSPDEQTMSFAYPIHERAALVAAEPDKFLMPQPAQLRYNWVSCRLDALDETEMRELLLEAWRMCVPQSISHGFLGPRSSR